MKFTTASLVENVVWQMRQTDLPRGDNRALIDKLANGDQPLTDLEAESAGVDVNVNFLDLPKICADARRTYYGAFLKPSRFFNVSLEYGPGWKRRDWSRVITAQINRIMKKSLKYFELLRSQYALTVLHGIGPVYWGDEDRWCPQCVGIEDVLIPSNTLLTMDNLSHFAIFRQYTPMELYNLIHGPKVDPAWNMKLVKAALDWADKQTQAQLAYSELYAPQKVEERWHQDLGFYGTDSVPTIDCWDFYFYSDEGKEQGWRRRIILDTPAAYEVSGGRSTVAPSKNVIGENRGEWLYCPDDERIYAASRENIIHFQFGDASSVAPFRYHSVRSLGWLLYAVCHLQNRMRCKLNDAIFENFLQYFRVAGESDREKVTKIDLHNFGIIPQDVQFVTQQERWQVNGQLAELGLTLNRQSMNEAAAQYREGRETDSATQKEKTATQVMAEVNSANALVGAMLLQSYKYAGFQYEEIARRFCRKNSRDKDVREFRKCVLRAGVPEDALDCSMWNIEVEKAMGSGNKILEVAMADKLMSTLPLHDPESQREILHIHDAAVSDDAELADRLVPMRQKRISNTVHDAQVMIGSLMNMVQIAPAPGENPIEMIEALLHGFGSVLQGYEVAGLPTPREFLGLNNINQTIEQWINLLAQDKNQAPKAKEYQKDLDELMKVVAEFGKALQQKKAEQQLGQPAPDPKDIAKAQAMVMQAQTKAQLAQQSHAQKTAQRDAQFKLKMQQDEQKHRMEMGKKMLDAELDVAKADLVTAADIRRGKIEAESAPAEKTAPESE